MFRSMALALACGLAGLACALPGSAARAGAAAIEECLGPEALGAALARLNALRAAGAACGPAAPLLAWDEGLVASAGAQATEMAARDVLSHLDAADRPLPMRLQAVGYMTTMAAENLAAGQPDFDAALAGWIASAEHCRNLMRPDVGRVGLACVRSAASRYGRFWVVLLAAAPR